MLLKMKKALACILVVMMFIEISVPAFAEKESQIYEITIQGTSAGHIYEAYQIFFGTLSGSVLSNVEWGSTLPWTRMAAV